MGNNVHFLNLTVDLLTFYAKYDILFLKGGVTMSEVSYISWHDISNNADELHGDFITKHIHNMHEVILTKQGALEVSINDKKYTVPPKSLIICNNIEMHLLTPVDYPYERYGLHISVAGLRKVPLNITYFSVITNHPQHFNNIFDVSDIFEEIEDIFKDINKEILDTRTIPSAVRDEHSEDIVRLKIGELLLKLRRSFPDRFTVHKSKNDCTILQIQQYIDENFARDISINDLAREAFISHTSFINAFKKLTGYSPKHYMLMCRLAESKILLCSTSLPISDIAFRVGFKDSNSFIRFFRQEMGLTPGEYRKINLRNVEK